MGKAVKNLFWLWLLVLIAFNSIPLGGEVSQSLSSNKISAFRLDYLVHAAMMLVFAWIWVLGRIMNINWFASRETLKYSAVIVLAGIGLESMQLLLPWRVYNPVDLVYNIVGATIAVKFVVISHLSTRKKVGYEA